MYESRFVSFPVTLMRKSSNFFLSNLSNQKRQKYSKLFTQASDFGDTNRLTNSPNSFTIELSAEVGIRTNVNAKNSIKR